MAISSEQHFLTRVLKAYHIRKSNKMIILTCFFIILSAKKY